MDGSLLRHLDPELEAAFTATDIAPRLAVICCVHRLAILAGLAAPQQPLPDAAAGPDFVCGSLPGPGAGVGTVGRGPAGGSAAAAIAGAGGGSDAGAGRLTAPGAAGAAGADGSGGTEVSGSGGVDAEMVRCATAVGRALWVWLLDLANSDEGLLRLNYQQVRIPMPQKMFCKKYAQQPKTKANLTVCVVLVCVANASHQELVPTMSIRTFERSCFGF